MRTPHQTYKTVWHESATVQVSVQLTGARTATGPPVRYVFKTIYSPVTETFQVVVEAVFEARSPYPVITVTPSTLSAF